MTLAILRKQFLVSSDSLHLVKELTHGHPAHHQVNRPEPNRLTRHLASELSTYIEPIALVEPRRIELLTSCVQSRRSPS